jgi:hypothetical protein
MAKGKRAVALFEVIRKDKRFDRQSPEPEKPAVDHSRKFAKQAVDLWRKNHSDPETWTDTGPTLRESFGALSARFASIYAAILSRISTTAAYLRLWISRSNGIIPGAAAATIVILVMLAARHWLHPAAPETSLEDALRAGPPHPEVLEISSPTAQPPAAQSPTVVAHTTPTTPPLSPEMAADEEQAAQQNLPNLAKPGQRIVNMHYVLMQSYFEQKTAQEACDFLNQNGIPCTIERGVKGWRSDFYQVIGLQGFVHPSGPQYTTYRDHIEDLGKKFSPKSRYKRFQPEAIKW